MSRAPALWIQPREAGVLASAPSSRAIHSMVLSGDTVRSNRNP